MASRDGARGANDGRGGRALANGTAERRRQLHQPGRTFGPRRARGSSRPGPLAFSKIGHVSVATSRNHLFDVDGWRVERGFGVDHEASRELPQGLARAASVSWRAAAIA